MFPKQHPRFYCPFCGAELPFEEPDPDLRVNCPVCGTQLVYELKHFWLFRLFCAIVAISIASLQYQEAPTIVLAALVYYALFFFVGARFAQPMLPLLLSLFPLYVRVFNPPLTTLRIDKK